MTYREIFTKLQVDLSKFNPNELVIVTYDAGRHDLQFTQLNQMIIASYLSPFFLPKKRFKLGVLTPSGLNKLRYNLEQLLANHLIDELRYIPDLMPLQTDWYRYFGVEVVVPVKAISLKYVNVTNKLMVKILCKRFNSNSKILYDIANKPKPKQE